MCIQRRDPFEEIERQDVEDVEEDEILPSFLSFPEYEEVSNMMDPIVLFGSDHDSFERSCKHLEEILLCYSPIPFSIDLYLDELLNRLMGFVKDNNLSIENKQRASIYFYHFVNFRGFKYVVDHLPYEENDLDMVMTMIEGQNYFDETKMELKFCLIIWLSSIVLQSFEMPVTDFVNTNRLLMICLAFLMLSNEKCRDAAAYLNAHILVREESMQLGYFKGFVSYIIKTLPTLEGNRYGTCGFLSALDYLLEYAGEENLSCFVFRFLNFIEEFNFKTSTDEQIAILYTKVIKRIGELFLSSQPFDGILPECHLHGEITEDNEGSLMENPDNVDGNEADSPFIDIIIEEIITKCLFHDSATVRYNAAKGLVHIVSLCTKSKVEDIYSFLMDIISEDNSQVCYHGFCLAMSAFERRILLLPEHLMRLTPFIDKALLFDNPNCYHPKGATAVREDTAYLCLSISQNYEAQILEPIFVQIGMTLLAMACYDKEPGCRLTASSVFQRFVTNLGNVSNGDNVCKLANFFTLQEITNAYLNVSVEIAKFPEYRMSLIVHLVENKILVWDPLICPLSAKTLGALTYLAPEFMASDVMNILLAMTKIPNYNSLYGPILAVGEIAQALVKMQHDEMCALPKAMIANQIQKVLEALTACTTVPKNAQYPVEWVLIRTAALKNLVDICISINIKTENDYSALVIYAVEVLLNRMHDCSSDDVVELGMLIRLEALSGLEKLMNMLSSDAPQLLHSLLVHKVFAQLLEKAFDLNDEVRITAIKIFLSLLHKDKDSGVIPHIPGLSKLKEVFAVDKCNNINWADNETAFSYILKLITIPEFTVYVLHGLLNIYCKSPNHMVFSSLTALNKQLDDLSPEQLESISYKVIQVFMTCWSKDFLMVPLLAFGSFLLSSKLLSVVFNDAESIFGTSLINQGKQIIKLNPEIKILHASIEFFCAFVQVKGKVRQRALGQLCEMLCHPLPCVRDFTAQRMLEVLKLRAEELGLSTAQLEAIKVILAETSWSKSNLEDLTIARNELCAILNV